MEICQFVLLHVFLKQLSSFLFSTQQFCNGVGIAGTTVLLWCVETPVLVHTSQLVKCKNCLCKQAQF